MSNKKFSIEQLQGHIDEIKKGLLISKDAENKLLLMLSRPDITENEAQAIVGEVIRNSSYYVQLKDSRKELIKIREDYFRGGPDVK